MRRAKHLTLAMLALSAGIAVVQPPVVAQGLVPIECPELTGTYSLENVSVRSQSVTLTFSFRLKNIGEPLAEIERFSLSNLPNTDFAYAWFGATRLAPGNEIARSRVIRVPLREYRRWESGGSPRLFVRLRRHFIQDPCGRARIDLARRIPPRQPEGV